MIRVACLLLALGLVSSATLAQPTQPAGLIQVPESTAPPTSPVTDAMLRVPPAADWLMWRRTFDSWGYSPLDQISGRNVGRLRLVWSRGLPQDGKQEGTPLVHEGVLYMPLPYSSIAALDASSGDLLWQYRRRLPDDFKKVLRMPDTQRNIAIYDQMIIAVGIDDSVYALDSRTGKLVWETLVNDIHVDTAQATSGPIVADGKVISGRGCLPRGGPRACVIVAHDARSGKELWRTSTIARPGEPGDETWGKVPYESRWHVGTWMPPSYDSDLKLIYFGTSVTSPAPKFALGGNDLTYLYHNSTLAIDVETGRIVWHYQHMVDHWDMDHVFERLLVEETLVPDPKVVRWINPKVRSGERRKVVTGIPGKTGIIYTLDARTGEFLWATPTVEQTVVTSIDGATGKATSNPALMFNAVGQEHRVCPAIVGGKSWMAGAYSPLTRLMYFPLQVGCMSMTAILDKPDLESQYGVVYYVLPSTPDVKTGNVWAISTETGRTVWKYEQRVATTSLVATGGGLLFGGSIDGRFRAFDQRTGKVEWEVNLGAPVTGYPITFAVGGKQYVAASTGASISTGMWNLMTPEIRPGTHSALFVFALPD